MKTKILIAILTVGVFSISTIKAQEKPMKMKQDTMQMDHSKMKMTDMKMDQHKMEMKKDSTAMKMDKMEMKHDSTAMKMDQSKMSKTFVCPMHPEVTSDKPGECPKCGMNMVEKKEDMKKMDMKKEDTLTKHKH